MKHTLIVDTDKADLIQQYQWAVDRLNAIIVTPPSTDLQRTACIVDEAKILLKVTKLLKKIILHEIS